MQMGFFGLGIPELIILALMGFFLVVVPVVVIVLGVTLSRKSSSAIPPAPSRQQLEIERLREDVQQLRAEIERLKQQASGSQGITRQEP